VGETASVADEVERVFRAHSEKLWRSVFLLSGDPDVTSDAVAEAFAQALQRGNAIAAVDRWVWRAAFRIALGELKHRGRHLPLSDDAIAVLPPDTVDLMRALPSLTPKQAGAVILHHYAGYSNRETAEILGSTTAAVGVHLERGRRKLRELLGDADD
jgi:DNA-directed RNA polymerase specialized sigma24 family protein